MRVLHVITSLRLGGAETLLSQLLPRLNGEEDRSVELAIFDGTRTALTGRLEKAGIKIHVLGMGARAMRSPWCILTLRHLMQQFDIVHTHNYAPQLFCAIAAATMRRTPILVTTEHNTTNRRRERRIFRIPDLWMYSRYAAIVACSPSVAASLREYLDCFGPRKDGDSCSVATKVIENGIELPTPLPLPAERGIIAMVAGFRAQKDHETLVRAFGLLSEMAEPRRLHLILAGDGETRAATEALARSLNLNVDDSPSLDQQSHSGNTIEFTGFVDNPARIYARAGVVVLSTHHEGLPLGAIEAVAYGRPLIATDIPALRELAETLPDAPITLVAPREPQALAEAIRTALQKLPAHSYSISNSLPRYDIARTAAAHITLYNNLLHHLASNNP